MSLFLDQNMQYVHFYLANNILPSKLTICGHSKFYHSWITNPSPHRNSSFEKGQWAHPMAINAHPPPLPPTMSIQQTKIRWPELEPTYTHNTLPHCTKMYMPTSHSSVRWKCVPVQHSMQWKGFCLWIMCIHVWQSVLPSEQLTHLQSAHLFSWQWLQTCLSMDHACWARDACSNSSTHPTNCKT